MTRLRTIGHRVLNNFAVVRLDELADKKKKTYTLSIFRNGTNEIERHTLEGDLFTKQEALDMFNTTVKDLVSEKASKETIADFYKGGMISSFRKNGYK